ncbi:MULTISPECIES: sensor histidine kinase [Streptomyces]|uniref:histidine kinase n=1 Tax=Streptomyces lasiicapitis TaxID=1923961 RepID=A0ABQ2LJI9_9ACTN|nr:MULTISPECIES: sensor histidine kinase [Streptomyces]QIB44025.1 sensor histidine kinase [Streptomyces aureoverticillatus]GGO35970.1 ATPase [Streptomyces lasiicapitis]
MRLRPFTVDVLLALGQVALLLLIGPEAAAVGWDDLDARGYALALLVIAPTVVRTKAPLAVCLVTYAFWATYVAVGYWPVVTSFGPIICLYTVALQCRTRTVGFCAGLIAAIWILGSLVSQDHASVPSVAAQAIGINAMVWRMGYLARRSAELARKTRAEQHERARHAVVEERGRIARELHDVVAHHMSVISVQAGLAKFVFDSDAKTARAALGTISGTSTEALEEMRRMLRVLRAREDDGEVPDAPMPGLARIEDMTDRVRAGGVPVEFRVTGTPRPIAPGVELCAYRVVQEALTNVLKHARHASATVELHYHRDHIEVSVTDNGEGVIPDRVRSGGGHGLIGMRERAKLYGGTISIGPRSAGGFAVRLTLPTSARAAPPGDDVTE